MDEITKSDTPDSWDEYFAALLALTDEAALASAALHAAADRYQECCDCREALEAWAAHRDTVDPYHPSKRR